MTTARGILVVMLATSALACGGAKHLMPEKTGTGGAAGAVTGAAGQGGGSGHATDAGADVGVTAAAGASGGDGAMAAEVADGASADGDAAADLASAVDAGTCLPSFDGGGGDAGASTTVGNDGGGLTRLPNGQCVRGAFMVHGECTCELGVPTVCSAGCTDVTVDDDNCGACGQACAPTATCNGGRCGRAVTSVVPRTEGCGAMQLAASPGTLYWTDLSHGTVKSLSGCATTTISSTEANPSLIVVGGSHLFWVDIKSVTVVDTGSSTTSTLREAALPAGPAMDLVTEANTTGGIRGLAVSDDGKTVFYSAGTKVRAIPVAGGAAVDVAREERGGVPTALALAGNQIAYLTELNGDLDIVTVVDGMVASCGALDPADPTGQTLLQVNCTRVARSQGAPFLGGLILRDGTVFWSNDSAIVSNSAAPGAAQANVQIALAVNDTSVTALVGDAETLFFTEDGLVEKTPLLMGSTAVGLARGQVSPNSIALDGSTLYWAPGDCSINAMTGL